MRNIKSPKTSEEKKVYELESACIDGYEYTKTYYRLDENGNPIKCDKGDDSAMTIINIRKQGQEEKQSKRTFIFSEGYIGAERSYNEDGTKRKSWAKKDGFGMSYLIKYIENGKANNIDNFHVMFMSDTLTSEQQATLFAKVIEDLTPDSIEKTFMWCHSKSGLLLLRTFEKMKDSQNPNVQKVLSKVKAIITSMPTQGLDTVNRPKMIEKLEENKFLKFMPFSGFIKLGLLSWYDAYLYKSTPAQVDLKRKTETKDLAVKPKGALGKFFDKISGNAAFHKKIANTKQVEYDSGYLDRTLDDENLKKLDGIDYKVLPVDLSINQALEGLTKHGQIMPLILYAKKMLSKDRGDGIVTYEDQGMDYLKVNYDKETVVNAGHDMPTTPEALKTIKEKMLDEKNQDEEER